MTQPSHRRWPFGLASVVAVLIACYALFCAGMSAWMGVGSMMKGGDLLPGVVLVILAALAVWYVVALLASLWFRREGLHIAFGLVVGFLMLWWFVGLVGHQIFTRLSRAGTWSLETYYEVFCVGPVMVAAWIVTGVLLIRPALVRRPAPDSR